MFNADSPKGSKKARWLRMFFFVLSLLAVAGVSRGGQVTVTWDAQTDPGLAGYKLYYGPQSRAYALYVDVGNLTTFTIPDLQDGETYYMAATAYDSTGVESDYSNEVTYAAHNPCTYAISPASQSFSASGGTGTIAVITEAGCNWTAAGIAWMAVTSGASGAGSGSVSYTVSPNSSTSARTGAASVAGQVLTVIQEGAAPAPAAYTITASAGTGGAISPEGTVALGGGEDQTFTISADTGYKIKSIQVDGRTLRGIDSYTFSNLSSDHTISATFSASSPPGKVRPGK